MKKTYNLLLFMLLLGSSQTLLAQDDIYYTPPSKPATPPTNTQTVPPPVQQNTATQTSPQKEMPKRDTRFFLGPKIGLTYNAMSIDPAPRDVTMKSLAGFTGGVGMVLELGSSLVLHTDVLITNKKSGFNYNINRYSDSAITTKYDIYYLSIPVMLAYTLLGQDEEKFKLYILAGGEINQTLNAHEKIKYSWDKDDVTYVIGSKKKVTTSELAISYGLGIRSRLNDRVYLSAESRLVRGVTDFNKGIFEYTGGTRPRIYNNGLNINVGLLFRLY